MKNTIILIIAFYTLLLSCKESKTADRKRVAKKDTSVTTDWIELTPEQIKNAGIVVGKPEMKDLHATLKVNGSIDVPPQNLVFVSVPLGGYVKSMRLLPGMAVARGAVLATLEAQEYIQLQQDYLIGKSKLEFLESDYARQKSLNETQTISNKVFQQVKSDYESQKVLTKALRQKLLLIGINPDRLNENNIRRSISIYSPISGYVSKVNVNTGKYVTATDVLFELINAADIHLNLLVFEKDVQKLSVGQKVVFYSNNNPSKKYVARIELINRSINDDRTSEVHCDIKNFDKSLQPGMFMNAEIEINNRNMNAVYDEAIVRWENRHYLFVAESKNKFRLTPVELGDANGGYTAIKNNLPEKDIVTQNAYALLMKMKNSSSE